MQRQKQNTELIVIVTPSIVNPIDAGTPLPELKYLRRVLAAEFSDSNAHARYQGCWKCASTSTSNDSCGEAFVEEYEAGVFSAGTIEGSMGVGGGGGGGSASTQPAPQ